MNYHEIFTNRVIIISGVGRSGTTILGKLIGSMKNVVYLFEPAIMKYFPVCQAAGYNKYTENLFLSLLFEDYILPTIQCRNINFRKKDWSYYGNYISKEDLKIRYKLERRVDAIKWIEENNVYFIIKTNESQYLYKEYGYLFDGVKFIYIYRDGFDTIKSMVKRGWFTDNYQPIDLCYLEEDLFYTNIPMWVEANIALTLWNEWNQITRCAYAWRRLNELGFKFFENFNSDRYISLNYFDLNSLFLFHGNKINDWGLKLTKLTQKHRNDVYKHKSNYSNMKERSLFYDIEESQRQPFYNMQKLIAENRI